LINAGAQDVDGLLRDRVNSDRNQSSIVVALVDETGTRFFSYGNTSKLKNAPAASQNTVFEIGSITK
jgi:CubicO group peptidase (beta-lactamase class C family)